MLSTWIALAMLVGSSSLVTSDNSTDVCVEEEGPWGSLLEEWAISPHQGDRHGRVMSLPPSSGYYVTDRVDRPPPPPPPGSPPLYGPPQPQGPQPQPGPPPSAAGPVPYSEWHPPPPPPSAGKIVNRPGGGPYKDKPFKPSPSYSGPPNQLPPYQGPNQQYQGPNQQNQGANQQYQGPNQQYQGPNQQNQDPNQQYQGPNQQYQGPNQQNQGPNQQYQGPNQQYQGPTQQYQGPNQPPLGNPHRGPGPMPSVDRVDEPPRKQVTETDLYLLGAIEKLVYRVDLMEKRLRKMEENVHFLVAGVDKKPDPCIADFTRVGESCYHFSSEAADWKSANMYCRKLRSNLLELDSDSQRRVMFAAMLADKRIRGKDIWTGGLNPGLLWIWSHSARPVVSNSTTTANATVTIVGEGRCLALVHDPAVNSYVYRGQDCALRHRYVCEKEEDKARLGNEIERVARGLKHSARQARLLIGGFLEGKE